SPREQRLGRHEGCPSPAGTELLAALRSWRGETARTTGTPPYAVLTDAALEAVAERTPRTEQELLAVPGIGQGKIASFGAELLDLVGPAGEKRRNCRSKNSFLLRHGGVESSTSIVHVVVRDTGTRAQEGS